MPGLLASPDAALPEAELTEGKLSDAEKALVVTIAIEAARGAARRFRVPDAAHRVDIDARRRGPNAAQLAMVSAVMYARPSKDESTP